MTATAPTSTLDGEPSRESAHQLLIPVLIAIGFAVSIVSSLGSPMVPTVAAIYGVSMNSAQWTLTAALLAGAVSTPLLSKLGDSLHRRRAIIGTLIVMTIGAVIALFDGPLWVLLVGRACQGSGLGLIALAMATARDHVHPAQLGKTMAVLSVTISAGVGLGYPLSGFVADHFGFHPTFIVAGVMSGLCALAAWAVLPKGEHLSHRRLDVGGALLMGIGLAIVVVAMSQMTTWGVMSLAFWGSLVLAAAVLALWVLWELRAEDPIIDLRTMRFTAVRTANAVSFIGGVGMYFLVSLIIRYVQTPTTTSYGMGHTVLFAGLILVPFSLASLLVSQVQPWLTRTVGQRWTCATGGSIFLFAMVLFALYRQSELLFFAVLFLAGFGVSVVNASVTPMIVNAVPPTETASAMGFNAVVRLVGGSVGSAASGAVLTANTVAGQRFPTDHGYVVAAMIGVVIWAVQVGVAWPRREGLRSVGFAS